MKFIRFLCNRNMYSKTTILLMVMAVLGFAGHNLYVKKGLPFRYSEEFNQINHARGINYSLTSYQNQNCIDRYPELKNFHSCLLNMNKDPEIVIIGDSHGLQYYQSFLEAYPNSSILNVSEFICLPAISDWIHSNFSFQCAIKTEKVIDFVKAHESIKTIILAGRWKSLMSFDTRFHSANIGLMNEMDYITFSRNLEKFIFEIEADKRKIVLIKDNPELDFDIQTCYVSRPIRAKKYRENCYVKSQDVIEKNYLVDRNFSVLSELYPRLEIFNTINVLCDSEYCSGIRDSNALYFDRNHLTKYGADLVVRSLQLGYPFSLKEKVEFGKNR